MALAISVLTINQWMEISRIESPTAITRLGPRHASFSATEL
jgi:hypothetical protein